MRINGLLLYVGGAIEREQVATPREVKGQKTWQESRARRIVEGRIGDPELECLSQKCVRYLSPNPDVVSALVVRKVGADSGVGQPALLAYGLGLVRKRI